MRPTPTCPYRGHNCRRARARSASVWSSTATVDARPVRSAPRWQWNTIGYAVWSSTSINRLISVGAGSRFAENVMSSWLTFAACVVRHSSMYHGMLLHTPRRFTTVRMPFSPMNA